MTEYSWEWVAKDNIQVSNTTNVKAPRINYRDLINRRLTEKMGGPAGVFMADEYIGAYLLAPAGGLNKDHDVEFYSFEDFLEWLDSND